MNINFDDINKELAELDTQEKEYDNEIKKLRDYIETNPKEMRRAIESNQDNSLINYHLKIEEQRKKIAILPFDYEGKVVFIN